MTSLIARVVLGLAGALLLFIGCSVVLTPGSFAAANGIALPDNPSLLSEVRAPGGLLLASAVFILTSALRGSFVAQAWGLSALVYGSYGLARAVSIALDGLPSASLTQAMVIELVIATVSLGVLLKLASPASNLKRR